MKTSKKTILRKNGWSVGDAKDFLGLSTDEAERVQKMLTAKKDGWDSDAVNKNGSRGTKKALIEGMSM